MEEQIEHYLAGELPPKEIDWLWEVFIMDSHWYGYFLTELHLQEISRDERSSQKRKVTLSQ
jgi:hypothetical protein